MQRIRLINQHFPSATDFILIYRGGEQVDYVNNLKETGGICDMSLGEISLYYNDEGEYGVYWDGQECYVVPADMEYGIRKIGRASCRERV